MPMQKYKPEQIVTILRQIEVAMANGKSTPQACKEAGITVQTLAEGVRRAEGRAGQEDEGTGEGEYPTEAAGGGTVAGEAGLEGRGGGKLLSPERRRCAVERAEHEYGMSERHGCWGNGEERNDTKRCNDPMRMN